MCYINPPVRKFENISPEGQRPSGDIFSKLLNWLVYTMQNYRSMNHDLYEITNNGHLYSLYFSPLFRKPHLLSMRMH